MKAASTFRRVTTWAMLALYGFVASGLPLPFGPPPAHSAAAKNIAGKDRSTPFPCMDKACGCDTAEKCFSSCCCHTPAETLAWAEARGIEPAVIDALTRRVAAVAPAPERQASCCAQAASAPKPSCCSTEEPHVDEAICSDYQSLAADPEPRLRAHGREPASTEPISDQVVAATGRVVILRDMLACNGLASWWSAIGVSLPPPARVACDLARPEVGVIVLHDVRIFGTGSPPDLPPPRGC